MFGRVNVLLYMLRSFDKGQAKVSARNWWRHFFIQESPHSKKEWVQAFGATICGTVWVDKRNLWLVNVALNTIDQSLNKCLTIQTWTEITDAFHSTRIPVWNFGNSTCPGERYIPVAQTRPKPPRVWLLFLWAGYKRAVLHGTTILSNGKGHFGPTDLNYQTGHVIQLYCT